MGEALRDKIEDVLLHYNCQNTKDRDGDGLRLVDVLSPFDTIEEGKDEILLLADEIACAILDDTDSQILSQAELKAWEEFATKILELHGEEHSKNQSNLRVGMQYLINRLLADRERLTGDLQANSMMLSLQCDLAREAEREALALTRRLRKYEPVQ